MSKSKSGLGKTRIPFLTHCCNIIVGCLHRCLAHLKDKRGEPVECWAQRTAKRNKHCPLCQSFTPHIHPERWAQIKPGGAPKVVGVGFMGDLCGEWAWLCPDTGQETRDSLFGQLAERIGGCPRHTFVSLTQRPDRLPNLDYPDNWFIGATVHNQYEADKHIPALLASGVKHCIVSYEPATGPVDFRRLIGGPDADGRCMRCGSEWEVDVQHECPEGFGRRIEGIIAGGMSGPGAVPADPDWFRRVRDDCAAAGVPFYFKQWGPRGAGRILDGRQHLELPWELPVRKQKSPVTSDQEAQDG